jgi:hypothetical protein
MPSLIRQPHVIRTKSGWKTTLADALSFGCHEKSPQHLPSGYGGPQCELRRSFGLLGRLRRSLWLIEGPVLDLHICPGLAPQRGQSILSGSRVSMVHTYLMTDATTQEDDAEFHP